MVDGAEAFFQGIAEREESGQLNVYALRGTNPDQAGRANVLSRETGIPADTVERNLTEVEGTSSAARARSIMGKYPVIASWSANPRNAAVGRDDVDGLGRVAETLSGYLSSTAMTPKRRGYGRAGGGISAADAFQELGDMARAIPAGLVSAFATTAKGTGDLMNVVERPFERAGDAMGYGAEAIGIMRPGTTDRHNAQMRDNSVGSRLRAAGSLIESGADFLRPPEVRRNVATDIAEGVGQVAGQIATFIATGGTAGTATLLAQGAGQMGDVALEKGLYGTAEGDLAVTAGAAVTAASEKVGLDFLIRRLPAPARGQLFSKFADILLSGGAEALQETVEGVAQNLITKGVLDPDQAILEGLDRQALAAGGTGAIVRSLLMTALPGRQRVGDLLRRRSEVEPAAEDAAFIEQLAARAVESKVRTRDPEAFRQFVEQQAEGTPVENVYVPGEALRSLMQSERIDFSDPANAWLMNYSTQIDEAAGLGGDVVIPIADAVTNLAGSPVWDAIKENVRLSPGGASLAEARSFEEDYAAALEERGREAAAAAQADMEAMAPARRVYEDVLSQARAAGFNLNTVRAYAEAWAERYQTRAERLPAKYPDAWAAYKESGLSIIQEAPASVQPYRKADQLDLLINAMRRGASGPEAVGPSLLEWVAKRGGVQDPGGDLASIGAADWHTEKPFRRRLIREASTAASLPGMSGVTPSNVHGPDTTALDAWEAGYFPDRTERPTVDEFLQAVRDELHGKPRYAPSVMSDQARETQAAVAQAADDLRSFLESRNVDADTATKADIEAAIAAREEESARGYEQALVAGINRLLEVVKQGGNAHDQVDFGTVSPWLVERAAENGIDLADMTHSADTAAIRHILNRHTDEAVEKSRGQLPIREADLRAIGAVLAAPDRVVFGVRNERSQDLVVLVKELSDGTTIYIEEVRTGKRKMALASMRRFPGAIGPDRIAATLNPHVRNAPRGELNIVDVPAGIKAVRSFEQSARGRIDFAADGSAVIRLFENRDLSTLLHEGGHAWLEELQRDAADPNATEQLRADWKAIVDWMAANGHVPQPDGSIPVEGHELFARSIERYFLEGKAPSSALSRAFASFRSWLVRIYKTAVGLNAPITDEVRQVMARLIATDEAIARAEGSTAAQALFTDAAQAGMTEAEFAAYQGTVAQARTSAFDALLTKTMATVRQARTAEWRRERATVREEVAKEIGARPEFQALALMRHRNPAERLPLSRRDLVEEYGPDVLAMIPKGVPPTVVDVGGIHPDMLAEKVGLASGWELIARLIGIQQRTHELREVKDSRSPMSEAIDIETDRIMHERHGDVLSDGSIEEEALAAIHGDTRASILAAEVRALARKKGDVPTPWQAAKAWAERTVREGTVIEQASASALARHERNEGKAGRAAMAAMLDGNIDEAFRQKQKEMLNHALYRAAKDAKDEIDKIVKRLGKLAKAKTLPSMDQEYLERIHDLLEAYDFRRRSGPQVAERESFAAWVAEKQEAGEEVYIPQRLIDASAVNFSKLQVGEVMGLNDAVQSIAHLGRLKKKILLAQEEREFEEVLAEAEAGAEPLPDRRFSSARNPRRSVARGIDSELFKIEALADQLDNGNPNGVFNRMLVRGATLSANEKARLQESVLTPLARLYLDMPKAQQKRLQQRVVVPEFINHATGQPTVFSRMDLIAVALNTGNDSNLDKLVRGERWSETAVQTVLWRELAEEDWKFVVAVWRQIDTLWPDIVRAEKEISGVEPEKVVGREVHTPFGVLEGGYYPVVYDLTKPDASTRVADHYEQDAQKLMGQMGRSVATPKGHTIERTNFAAPLMLSVEAVLFNHINRVTTRIAYGRYVRDALKFIGHPRVRTIVDRKAGLEYYSKLKPWLQRQVNEAALNTDQLHWFNAILRQSRINATIVGLGLRWTTMVSQISGWNNSAAFIGPKWLAVGMAETVRNAGANTEFIFGKSEEMSRRRQERERDTADFFRGLGKARKGFDGTVTGNTMAALGKVDDALHLDKLRSFAFWGIGMIDLYMVSMPTWMGAYRKGLSEGMSDEDAAAYGDKAVRRSQGSGLAKDLSMIQGGPEGMRFATMFYSYFNVLYNQQRDAVQAARRGDWRKAAMITFWAGMAGPLAGALLTGDWPQEEEEWPEWALRKMFFGLWAGVPLVRDLLGVVERKASGQYAGTPTHPLFRAGESIMKVGTDAIRGVKGEDVSDRWVKHAVEAPGYFFGLPSGQASNTAQFLYDVEQGNADPDGFDDWYTGLTKGKVEE